MKAIKTYLPLVLLILFEAVVGILLLNNPEGFTRSILLVFGLIMLVIGAIELIGFFRDRREGHDNWLAAAGGGLALLVGVLCTFFPGLIMGLFSVLAVLYGVILLISGIYKLQTYSQQKKLRLHPHFLALLAAVAAVVFGLVIILNPFSTVLTLWQFSGIVLICEAALDIAALIFSGRLVK